MPTIKGIAKLELAKGQKNHKGLVMKTNRFKVEGAMKGTLYCDEVLAEEFEIVATLGKPK